MSLILFCYDKIYIVSPIEKSESTDEFMKRTDSTFNLSNRTSTNSALYYLLLMGESMISREALPRSTPINSEIAYPHSATISSIDFSEILLPTMG